MQKPTQVVGRRVAAHGMPVGLSFIGPAWSEARLLSLGYAFEQAGK